MISGIHAILYAHDADRVRAFFRDVLQFQSVDAGHGWLIFALPPAELGIHPTGGDQHHELYLMCEDVAAAVEKLGRHGVEVTQPPTAQGWGVLARFNLPGGGPIGLYQPRHPTALKPGQNS